MLSNTTAKSLLAPRAASNAARPAPTIGGGRFAALQDTEVTGRFDDVPGAYPKAKGLSRIRLSP